MLKKCFRLGILTGLFIILIVGCNKRTDIIDIQIIAFPASEAIVTSVSKQKGKTGIQYYHVTLSNTGNTLLTLRDIEINFTPFAKINPKTELLAGGTCMGRTPIQRYLISEVSGKDIKSGMFLMFRNGEKDYSLVGFLSWKIFLPYIHYKDNSIIITADAEGKQLKSKDAIHFEKIITIQGDNWQDVLDDFAVAIARENNIRQVKDAEFRGWATWDYYGRGFTQEDIYNNVKEISKLDSSTNLIQIDGGWWTERGDYLSPRSDLSDGMKGIAQFIEKNGYTPGIHLDGFRADSASDIAKEHPEYFLKDENGKIIVTHKEKYDRDMNYIYFDYSHPGARDYIKHVLRTIKNDWGYKYFKIDFMRYGLKEFIMKVNPDLKGIQSFLPGLTGIERFRLGMTAIKEAIGNDAYFLGCSAVFGPCIGFVDGMRTGGDISPTFDFYQSRCLQNGGNYYLHKKVFNCDADYLVFRNKDDEDEKVQPGRHKCGGDLKLNEAKMWADYSALFSSTKLASDNLQILRNERKALLEKTFSISSCDKFIPIDLWNNAKGKNDAPSFFLGKNEDGCYLAVFNWEDKPVEMNITGFQRGEKQYLVCHPTGDKIIIKNGQMKLTLENRSSVISKYSGNSDFDTLRKNLKIFTKN